MLKLFAQLNHNTYEMFICKVMDLSDKIINTHKISNEKYDFSACINVLEQLEEMYDDVLKGK